MALEQISAEIKDNLAIAPMLISHTTVFRRKISVNKFKNLKVDDINIAKEHICKLAYSISESHYLGKYELMSNTVDKDIKTYYDTNWHNIRTEWVTGLVLIINAMV